MLEVRALSGFATVQDGGRPGHMHEGIPAGGALVPELLARANAAVGNAHDDPGIELVGALTLAAEARIEIATCDGDTRRLAEGAELQVAPVGVTGSWVRYIAVRGGIDVPVVLGGRGTLILAGIGGHQGRLLRIGDRLRAGSSTVRRLPLPPLPDFAAPIEVVLGPDRERFPPGAIDTLLGARFTVHPYRSRVGMRLSGPVLERVAGDGGVSAPMVRGAIQVPGSGEAIVLGPDHPTTGGYPVLATVVRSSLGALFGRPVGAEVRFVAALPRSFHERR